MQKLSLRFVMADMGENQNSKRSTSSSNVDRISSLPDKTIRHIFSFLPTQYLVKSSVLSKRWTNLWRSAPCLYFDLQDFCCFNYSVSRFEKFVDSVFRLRDPSDIQKFRLYWDIPVLIYSADLVFDWLAFAVERNVQVLELGVQIEMENDDQTDYYTLPASLFSCGSLQELTLGFNNALPHKIPTSITLSHLKFLEMDSVIIPTDEQSTHEAAFFSACPLLETLILQDCIVEDCVLISIESFHLKNLTISDGFLGDRSMGPCNRNINAPNLVRLRLALQQSPDDLNVLNVPSVVNAHVELDPSLHLLTSQVEILRAISNAQIIELSCFDIEEDLLGELSFPFSKLKCMNLLRVGAYTIAWTVSLMKCSSNLESLNIKFNQRLYSEHLTWKDAMVGSFPMLHHLKSVVIEDFQGYVDEIKLVQFLVEKSVVLEKMTISSWYVRKDSSAEKRLKKFNDKLLSYPQSSSNAQIIFQLRGSPY